MIIIKDRNDVREKRYNLSSGYFPFDSKVDAPIFMSLSKIIDYCHERRVAHSRQ